MTLAGDASRDVAGVRSHRHPLAGHGHGDPGGLEGGPALAPSRLHALRVLRPQQRPDPLPPAGHLGRWNLGRGPRPLGDGPPDGPLQLPGYQRLVVLPPTSGRVTRRPSSAWSSSATAFLIAARPPLLAPQAGAVGVAGVGVAQQLGRPRHVPLRERRLGPHPAAGAARAPAASSGSDSQNRIPACRSAPFRRTGVSVRGGPSSGAGASARLHQGSPGRPSTPQCREELRLRLPRRHRSGRATVPFLSRYRWRSPPS